ncbi:cycle-inhibiting factor [Burkholderia ubonensis]|uniref:cycle-inhibiting factor n=1 Tax=Burkholderia ubonensis TaxID=101571 RepID=UPI0012FB4E4D|nr:cycle-inhibiting factor [Burkholderia ubonensis]
MLLHQTCILEFFMIQNTSAMASGLYRSVEPPVTSGLEPAFGEHLPFSGITSHLLGEFCEFGARNLSANLLICDDSDGPIFERNPSEIFAKISEVYNSIKQSWISEIELAELGIPSPHSIQEPVCGSSANFMMKLFLDDDSHSYKFNKSQCVSFDELCDRLDSLERDRSYVLRMNDGLLGHAYIVDIPAHDSMDRPSFLYQSDLGEGATKSVRLSNWMSQNGKKPINLSKIIEHFKNSRDGAQGEMAVRLVAELFDKFGDERNIDSTKFTLGKESSYFIKEYCPKNLEHNIATLSEKCRG